MVAICFGIIKNLVIVFYNQIFPFSYMQKIFLARGEWLGVWMLQVSNRLDFKANKDNSRSIIIFLNPFTA